MGTFDNINRIYECLMDEETKYIFEKRLLYSLSNDIEYINKIVNEKFFYHMISQFRRETFLNDSNLIKVCDILNNKEIVIYGAGGYGLLYVALFKAGITNGTVIGFLDKYKKEDFFGLSEIDIEKIKEDKLYLLITPKDITLKNEIEIELKEKGVSQDRILRFDNLDLMDYTGIYCPDFWKLKNEVFIDGGCYDGKSSISIINNCKDYKKIYAFEPDTENIKLIKNSLLDENIEIIKCGLWNKKDFLFFSKGGQASRIEEIGNETIEVNAIDNCISDIVTYIKMDIEGAEINALLGAKNLIEKFHPKLAISIYHKKNDIIDIPLTILKIDSRYKFYLRHYSPGTYDTVLYAVIE